MTRHMIQLSPRGALIYQLLNVAVALLLPYILGLLLAALNQLPAQPLGVWAARVDSFTEQTFKLLLLTGFLAAGLMMADDGSLTGALGRIWLVCVGASLALSGFGQAPLAEGMTALVLLVALVWSLRLRPSSTFLRCWRIGLLLAAQSSALAMLGDQRLADLNAAFQVQVAFVLCSISVVFWLIPRYSRLDRDWADGGLRITGVLVFLGGGMISLGRLIMPAALSLAAAPLISLAFVLLASHSARALRNRNENATLAPHWIALATILWLVGGGFLGALSVQPGIAEAMRGTDLAAAQQWLGGWVSLAVVLGFVNEAAAALRGDNLRVTGYAPFWLIGFGVGLSSIVLVCRGVLQIYLPDLAPAAELELMLPLTRVWLICQLAVAAGMALYAIGFWLRRPRIRVVDG
ncbi:MAG: hypothetical protein F4X02_14030 [Chloroflexi bacterium]|nr:hypothetical protein [Chloroflexota bacterium]